MEMIRDWKGNKIEVTRSKKGVCAVVNPFDNLVRTVDMKPWPPPEILQKLYKSNHEKAFVEEDLIAATKFLGFYSDMQSLHSEDAITWSVFGPIIYAAPETVYFVKKNIVEALLMLVDVPVENIDNVNLWLWRRIPHPDTLVPGGPEIDFGIQCSNVVILGEAKWLSGIGKGQGKAGDKDQIVLRKEFFKKYGHKIFGDVSNFVILGVSLEGGMLEQREEKLKDSKLYFRDTTWKSICDLPNPALNDLPAYFKWKRNHSKLN